MIEQRNNNELPSAVNRIGKVGKERPDVSVIIPTHNRPSELLSALQSVLLQKLGATVEALVINDGQLFDYSILKPFSQAMPISVIELNTSSGPSIARNLGIDQNKKEVVTQSGHH